MRHRDTIISHRRAFRQCSTQRLNFVMSLKSNILIYLGLTGHSPWRNGYSHRRVNVRIVVGKVTVEYAFVRVLLFMLFNIISSVLYAHSYIPDGIQS
jgi:hypothetical protein